MFKLFGPYIGLQRLCWVSGVIILIDWQKAKLLHCRFSNCPEFSPWKLFSSASTLDDSFFWGLYEELLALNNCDCPGFPMQHLTELMWFMWVVEVVWVSLGDSLKFSVISFSFLWSTTLIPRVEEKAKKKKFWTYLEGFINKRSHVYFINIYNATVRIYPFLF